MTILKYIYIYIFVFIQASHCQHHDHELEWVLGSILLLLPFWTWNLASSLLVLLGCMHSSLICNHETLLLPQTRGGSLLKQWHHTIGKHSQHTSKNPCHNEFIMGSEMLHSIFCPSSINSSGLSPVKAMYVQVVGTSPTMQASTRSIGVFDGAVSRGFCKLDKLKPLGLN